ncbi:hypothetical protein C8R45DRAFT_1104200 [Mycena sanguinolenta]|nr:hypothetical protein C8R45DRAFT_1104200 [Mycena sanguinolenta]
MASRRSRAAFRLVATEASLSPSLHTRPGVDAALSAKFARLYSKFFPSVCMLDGCQAVMMDDLSAFDTGTPRASGYLWEPWVQFHARDDDGAVRGVLQYPTARAMGWDHMHTCVSALLKCVPSNPRPRLHVTSDWTCARPISFFDPFALQQMRHLPRVAVIPRCVCPVVKEERFARTRHNRPCYSLVPSRLHFPTPSPHQPHITPPP